MNRQVAKDAKKKREESKEKQEQISCGKKGPFLAFSSFLGVLGDLAVQFLETPRHAE
jgi:hypothetical protein